MVKFTAANIAPLFVPLTFLPTLPIAWSAECFKQSGATNCVTWNGIWALRDTYCNKFWNLPGVAWIGKDPYNGYYAQFAHTTSFGSQQECWDSYDNIAHECYGEENGGSWSWNANSAVLDFCVTVKDN